MSTAASPSSSSVTERFIETVGPIVVKEVRQGLRARVFAIFFGTLLVACLSMALIALAEAQDSVGSTFGKDFFGAYLTALGGICFFVIPFVAFRSMARELEDETWVLLTLTGLGPSAITRGKWTSAMSQALLFASACAPFVLFTYFLNGIDLVQIVTALVLAAAYCSFLTGLALAIATQAHSKLGRTVATFVVIGLLGMATIGGVAFAWVIAEEGRRLTNNDAFRNFTIGLAIFVSLFTWLVLEGSAAGLALPSQPASRGPRVAFTIISLLGLAFGLVLFVIQKGGENDAMGGQIVTCLFLTGCGVFCISERDGWPLQANSGGWLRAGAMRSFLLVLGLLAASTLLWGFLMMKARGGTHFSADKPMRALVGAFIYPAMYLSLGAIFGRVTPLRRLGEPVASRVGFILAVVLGVLFSVLLSFLVDGRPDGKITNALNPLVGMVNFVDRSSRDLDVALMAAVTVGLLCIVSALFVLAYRDRERTT
ncbi:MAG: hypothetical protein JNM17_34605 [Archangium sp.]|nr:hypothetical protein [Archangium sp.]